MPRKPDGEILTYGRDGWAARGHITQEAMQDAARAFLHDDAATVGPVTHCWWRFVPNPEWPEEGMIGYYTDATPGARGAFRVTREEAA